MSRFNFPEGHPGHENSGQFDPRARDNSQVRRETQDADQEVNQHFRTLVEAGFAPVVAEKVLARWQGNVPHVDVEVSNDGVVHELFRK